MKQKMKAVSEGRTAGPGGEGFCHVAACCPPLHTIMIV